MEQVRNDQADKIGAPGHEAARGKVRPVIKLFYARQNPLASLVADVWMIAQHLGDGNH
jgi:hypothetical protein